MFASVGAALELELEGTGDLCPQTRAQMHKIRKGPLATKDLLDCLRAILIPLPDV